jgi:hypothetical protein
MATSCGHGSTTVFVVAPEEVLTAETHAAAVIRCRELGIAGISQQAWALRTKIAQAAMVASERGARRAAHLVLRKPGVEVLVVIGCAPDFD